MNKWKQLGYDFGLAIVFPRLCLFVLIPCLLLLCPFLPNQADLPRLLHSRPVYVESVFAVAVVLFLLAVTANLAISRHLRRSWTEASPYEYRSGDGFPHSTRYFRILVRDKAAFRLLLKNQRRGPGLGATRWWLWVDELLFDSAAFLVLTVCIAPFLLMMGVTWAVKQGLSRLRKPLFGTA